MTFRKLHTLLITTLFLCLSYLHAEPADRITIAILAKDKAHTLPLYLSCIESQTWPKEKTFLYIRTNNNNDDTAQILQQWVESVENSYAGIFFDECDVAEEVQKYKQHEWNEIRFQVLGKIRQDSIQWAKEQGSHYFVADCDNFIHSHTLEQLFFCHMPIVAPLLTIGNGAYSNYHAAIDHEGYYEPSPFYLPILNLEIRGLIEMPVVHCTYFIRHEYLDRMVYDDGSGRYEYVIFSDNARKMNIPQYLDNREVYGHISFAENKEDFDQEPWLHEFLQYVKK